MPLSVRRSRVFEMGVDALVYALVVIVAVRVAVDGGPRAISGAILAVATAVVYTAGTFPTRRHGRAAAVWFAATAGLWVALVAVDVAGVYLGFALFFVALDRFVPRVAVAVVTGITAVIVVAEVVHQPSLGVPSVIGPIIGAVVAVAMGLGYRSLEHENEQRRALIDELHHTQAELAEAEHERGVLEERERLAREIHDTVAQGLASIVILLGATSQELAGGDLDSATEHIDQARSTARVNLDEARRFVRALGPAALDQTSLEQALQRLCDEASVPGVLKVRFVTSGEPYPLPPSTEIALLRIAQSALANMAAHSGARHGQLTLTSMSDRVTLDVHDDGRGFDPAQVGAPAAGAEGGFGLVAMQQRVAALGGTLTVESAPGHGTVVAATVPTVPPVLPVPTVPTVPPVPPAPAPTRVAPPEAASSPVHPQTSFWLGRIGPGPDPSQPEQVGDGVPGARTVGP